MNVNLIKEHENGDATYQFDLTASEAQALLTFGILEAVSYTHLTLPTNREV